MMSDNRTPTPGKDPWFARPRSYENETVRVNSAAAATPHGYTRDVWLSQVIDEPGKGAKNPPRREISTRLHSADSITLGIHLVENGISAERRNAADGEGGEREPYFEHPRGHAERRMEEDFARGNKRLADAVLARLKDWQEQHPDVADYRMDGAIGALAKASAYLGYLTDDTTPDVDAARRARYADGFFTDTRAADSQHQEATQSGVMTGLPASRRVPRLRATGKYYVTATRAVRVRVKAVSTNTVQLTVTDDEAADYPEGITSPRSELGTWLTLDNPRDWTLTDD